MSKSLHAVLSRRERQIMDILYELGRHGRRRHEGAARRAQRFDGADPIAGPGGQGHVRREEDGQSCVYLPVVPRRVVRKSALKHVMNTFFDGSAEKVVAALLGPDGGRLSDQELDRIAEIVEKARAEESK